MLHKYFVSVLTELNCWVPVSISGFINTITNLNIGETLGELLYILLHSCFYIFAAGIQYKTLTFGYKPRRMPRIFRFRRYWDYHLRGEYRLYWLVVYGRFIYGREWARLFMWWSWFVEQKNWLPKSWTSLNIRRETLSLTLYYTTSAAHAGTVTQDNFVILPIGSCHKIKCRLVIL